MTGITDVYKSSQRASRFVWAWLRLHLFVRRAQVSLKECPQPTLPDPRPTIALAKAAAAAAAAAAASRPKAAQQPLRASDALRHHGSALEWSLLLPITSRGCQSSDELWTRIAATAAKLTTTVDAARTTVHVAVDMKDPELDSDGSRGRLSQMLDGLQLRFHRLAPAYSGSLCWIWAELAGIAVADGADLFMLIGDDVHFESRGWQRSVEDMFAIIAAETGLPFGCACVAVRDTTFAAFPTFPVTHRLHLTVFESLFPPGFKNQHGDPFLWEVYRRWGASRFAAAQLANTVGGAHEARYAKSAGFVWRDAVLTEAIATLRRWLAAHAPDAQPMRCLDVVVPTYRCNVAMLRPLANLQCPSDARVALHTLIIVDNPSAGNLPEVQALVSYAPNRTVRVFVMSKNSGASAARNMGLSQCFGDHAILLDDDVVPSAQLVPAYVGAIARYPHAAGYVGLTTLPQPQTLLQHAIATCGICFFYSIAQVKEHPPWGVTANVCVPARTQNTTWFSDQYPKTGGGEDVDFCIKLRRTLKSELVAVQHAVVEHPFWSAPLRQVAGWASGDVRCLDALPQCAFYAAPNWAVIALACALLQRWAWALLALLLEVVLLAATYAHNVPACAPVHKRVAILALATLPALLQDTVRACSKIARFRWLQMLQHFDWMDGSGDHVPATQAALLIKALLWATTVAAFEYVPLRPAAAAALACAVALCAQLQGRVMAPVRAHCSNPLPLRSAATPFVVLATQRTGSNMLCGLLHGVRGISMHNELFNDKGVFSHCGGIDTSLHRRDAAPGAFLLDALSIANSEAVGFKLFPEHMRRDPVRRELLARVLTDPRIRKIILLRENRLAVAASRLRASTTGAFTHRQLSAVRVHIDPAELQDAIDSYDAFYRYVREATAGQHVHQLSYEELCGATLTQLGSVCAFLGVSAPATLPKNIFRAQTDGGLREAVANWEELRSAFRYSERARDFE